MQFCLLGRFHNYMLESSRRKGSSYLETHSWCRDGVEHACAWGLAVKCRIRMTELDISKDLETIDYNLFAEMTDR